MTDAPPPGSPGPPPRSAAPRPRKRQPKPKRTLAKVLFFSVFLAIFGTIDVIAWRYESAARKVYEQASRNPVTWRKVCQEYPLAYVGCRARARLLAEAPEQVATELPALSLRAQQVSRDAVAPALRWLVSMGAPASWSDAALRAETATFDPLKISLMPLLAALFAFALASYQLFAFWRTDVLSAKWRSVLFVVATAALAWHWMRVYGPMPEAGARLLTWGYFFEAEYLTSLVLALVAFCCLFYVPRPERPSRVVRDTAPASPQG